jgi:hypothetical protein
MRYLLTILVGNLERAGQLDNFFQLDHKMTSPFTVRRNHMITLKTIQQGRTSLFQHQIVYTNEICFSTHILSCCDSWCNEKQLTVVPRFAE